MQADDVQVFVGHVPVVGMGVFVAVVGFSGNAEADARGEVGQELADLGPGGGGGGDGGEMSSLGGRVRGYF